MKWRCFDALHIINKGFTTVYVLFLSFSIYKKYIMHTVNGKWSKSIKSLWNFPLNYSEWLWCLCYQQNKLKVVSIWLFLCKVKAIKWLLYNSHLKLHLMWHVLERLSFFILCFVFFVNVVVVFLQIVSH